MAAPTPPITESSVALTVLGFEQPQIAARVGKPLGQRFTRPLAAIVNVLEQPHGRARREPQRLAIVHPERVTPVARVELHGGSVVGLKGQRDHQLAARRAADSTDWCGGHRERPPC